MSRYDPPSSDAEEELYQWSLRPDPVEEAEFKTIPKPYKHLEITEDGDLIPYQSERSRYE